MNGPTAVIGRGIIGLAIARRLVQAGHRVLLVGKSHAAVADASLAAVGVSTLKGQLNPQHPLFALKAAGHDRLPVWLDQLEQESGQAIRRIWGPVYEPWHTLVEQRWLGHRIFHRELRGFMRTEVVRGGREEHPYLAQAQGYLHHHEDGWFHPEDAMNALRAGLESSGQCEVLCERVNSVVCLDGGVSLRGEFGEVSAERVIIATGWETSKLLHSSGLPPLDLQAIGGSTYCEESHLRSKELWATKPTVIVKKMMNAALGADFIRLGSDSHLVHKPEDNLGKNPGINAELEAWNRAIVGPKLGGNWTWGMRARTRDRNPVFGPWGRHKVGGKQAVYIATGAYKNGLQVADLMAEGVVSCLDNKPLPRLLDPFLVKL